MKKIGQKLQQLLYVINESTPLQIKVNSVELKHTFPFYPIVALFIGLIFVGLIYFFKQLINPYIIAVITSLTFAPYLYYLNSGKNLNALMRISKKLELSSTNDFLQTVVQHTSMFTLNTVCICKIIIVGFVAFYQPSWLILVPITSATTFATFYAAATKDSHSLSTLQIFTPWIIALSFSLIIGGIAAYATLTTIAFISYLVFRSFEKMQSEQAQDLLFGFCELSECLALAGALLAI